MIGIGRAAALGAGCTLTALLGYGLMTWSPIEGAHLTWAAAVGFVSGDRLAFLGGAVTGPLFGWFGHGWRTRRAWVGASIAAGAFLLEPLAHAFVHDPVNSVAVSRAEIAAGTIMVGYVAAAAVRTHLRPSRQASTRTG